MTQWNGLHRTPLSRGTSRLARTRLPARTRGIPRQSAKRKAVSGERSAFVKRFLAEHPVCEMCSDPSTEVHESIRQGKLGARVPGPKATEQGQTFHALCHDHHDLCTNPVGEQITWLLERGFIQSGFEGLR